MSVEQADAVDLIGVDRGTGDVVLTISDHLPWDYDEHLLILQKKLNTYLAFIESGELVAEYPDAHGRKSRISVTCKYPPDDRGLEFFAAVEERIEGAGILFEWDTLAQ